jgi:hypothetical protein
MVFLFYVECGDATFFFDTDSHVIERGHHFLYKMHKNRFTNLCTHPNFSYDGFSPQTDFLQGLLISRRNQGGNKK